MAIIWKAFYNTIVVPALFVGFHITARFNPKTREGIAGRQNVFKFLENQLESARELDQTAWFHFTSVGEFEQAKPLIEAIQDNARIVLTYFSPSVQPSVAKYPHCDAVSYLPLDTARNAKRLIELIKPSILIFSKFDIWPNLVWCASKHRVSIILIAGALNAKSKRLAPFARSFFKCVQQCLALHCVISDRDAQRFRRICPSNTEIEVTGDTRFDRVYQHAVAVDSEAQLFPGQSTLQRPILIAGSTYSADERVLLEAYSLLRKDSPQDMPCLILVPHEPTAERITEIQTQLDRQRFSHTCFSQLHAGADLSQIDVIVIDTVGLLAKLYRLGNIAFVGGSFHGSVHNVMEPAAMAKPVLFGPTIHNAYEAYLLKDRRAARLVNSAQELADALKSLFSNAGLRNRMGKIAVETIEENLGATERTLARIKPYLT
jgi:3-deoxy-D-manno-octulosonic-acid transferase